MFITVLISERAPVGFNDELAQRQANAAATRFAGFSEFKDFRAALRWHAGTVIADIDDELIAVHFGLHFNLAPVRLRFHRIAQKVIEALPQARCITLNGPTPADRLSRQMNLLGGTIGSDTLQTHD